jgi:hypothetical protein
MFSVFNISQKEILASRTRRGSFLPVIKMKAFGAMEGIRKVLASSLYRQAGYFTKASQSGTIASGNNTIIVSTSGALGVDIGSVFNFGDPATYLVPSGSADCTVTAINPLAFDSNGYLPYELKFTSSGTGSYSAGDPLILRGSSNSSGIIAPMGLDAWVPTTNRGSTLFGIDRSAAPDRLSGKVVDDSALPRATTPIIDSLIKGQAYVRVGGGKLSDYICAINSWDYLKLTQQLQDKSRFYQADDGSKKGNNIRGIGQQDVSIAFATSIMDTVIDDPYCTEGEAWFFNPKDISFITYSNKARIGNLSEGAENNQDGRSDPNGAPEVGEEPMKVNIDDLFTVEPAASSSDGPAVAVSANIYGTFVVHNTANIVRVKLPAA